MYKPISISKNSSVYSTNTQSIETSINSVKSRQMGRSQFMARNKQQLKLQLLGGLVASTQKSGYFPTKQQYRDIFDSSTVDSERVQIRQKKEIDGKYTILDEFRKNRVIVQEQKHSFIDQFIHQAKPIYQSPIQEYKQEVQEERSILDVSKNLTNIKFITDKKSEVSEEEKVEQKIMKIEQKQKEKEKPSNPENGVKVAKIDLKSYMKKRQQENSESELSEIVRKPSSIKDLIMKTKKKQVIESEEDLTELFPPYQSSSENLNKQLSAVIEEEQESEDFKSEKGHVKSISLSELNLQDISDITVHQNSNNKIIEEKNGKSQKTEKHSESSWRASEDQEKEKVQKFVVKDILSDISGLKEKMVEDMGDGNNFWKKIEKPITEQQEEGSQGIENEENSMVDFIEGFQESLDCGEFKEGVDRLKNKIVNDLCI